MTFIYGKFVKTFQKPPSPKPLYQKDKLVCKHPEIVIIQVYSIYDPHGPEKLKVKKHSQVMWNQIIVPWGQSWSAIGDKIVT